MKSIETDFMSEAVHEDMPTHGWQEVLAGACIFALLTLSIAVWIGQSPVN